jgi:hypothetical protein
LRPSRFEGSHIFFKIILKFDRATGIQIIILSEPLEGWGVRLANIAIAKSSFLFPPHLNPLPKGGEGIKRKELLAIALGIFT